MPQLPAFMLLLPPAAAGCADYFKRHASYFP